MDIKNLANVAAFVTKDESEIRELLAHRNSAIRHQSLAEARLAPGASTQEHYHVKAEEIYYITHGVGRIRIDGEVRDVFSGDAIAILPGQRHKLWNTGSDVLRLLCCCAPAYEHEDTVITERELVKDAPPGGPGFVTSLRSFPSSPRHRESRPTQNESGS
jgi:mannose-6-phosphate isomerase-like protein (cupin superfamily)